MKTFSCAHKTSILVPHSHMVPQCRSPALHPLASIHLYRVEVRIKELLAYRNSHPLHPNEHLLCHLQVRTQPLHRFITNSALSLATRFHPTSFIAKLTFDLVNGLLEYASDTSCIRWSREQINSKFEG